MFGGPPGQPYRDEQANFSTHESAHTWLPALKSPRQRGSSGGASWLEGRSSRTPRRTPASEIAHSPVFASPRSPRSGLTPAGLSNEHVDAKKMYPYPPNWRPEGKSHRDSWVNRPRHTTRTELMETYHRSRLPDDTYDVDGDGVVSMEDLYLASKFDVNGDGILQDDETVELRKQMVSTLLRSYEELPHAGNNIKVRGIIKKFRNDPTQEVQSRHFMKSYTSLQTNYKQQSAQDSRMLYQSLEARAVPASFEPIQDAFTWREQSFRDKNAGFVPRS